MNDALLKLIWLIPTSFLVGFIYAAIRSQSAREFVHHGLRQSISILAGMTVLGLILFWLSRQI